MNFKIFNARGKEIQTDVSLYPGKVLLDELEAREIPKNVFAELLGMRASRLSELLHGKSHFDAATALKLEDLLDISAEYWMLVQVCYELLAERHKRKLIKKQNKEILSYCIYQ